MAARASFGTAKTAKQPCHCLAADLGATVSLRCVSSPAMREYQSKTTVQLPELESASPYRLSGYGQEYWVPRYYRPDIVVIHPGCRRIARVHRCLFRLRRVRMSVRFTSGGPSVGGGGRSSGGFRLGGGSGGGGDAGKGFAILAVVAIVVMPVILITLATVRPESESRQRQTTDAAHALNDMLRSGVCRVSPKPSEPGRCGRTPA